MNMLSNSSRFDTIIIWGHGLKYKKDILDMIRNVDCFDIVRIIKHYPKDMKKFIREVYSYDYAPIVHLKSKIKYLESVDACLLCIVIKNNAPEVDILGDGKFRHYESLRLKQLKTVIREKFNPYKNGVMTHDHIIHATDNEEQTDHILKAIGDISVLDHYHQNLFSIPSFLGKQVEYRIAEISVEQLLCGQAEGKSHDFSIVHMPVKESVQYLSLGTDGENYKQYVENFTGTALKSDYHVEKFLSLADNFDYLSTNFENDFVVVKELNAGLYLIVDGLHRASIHISQGNTTIKVCVIK